MKVYISAIITSKPEFQDEVREALMDLVKATQQEEACILYDLHQDIDDGNRFLFYEIWEDQEGLDKHNQMPHIKTFQAFSQGKLQVPVMVYKAMKI
ncbi:putative quinol monooxygenase [Allomuricauda taeanensis]|uniref:putative quinol monooxygenase n=1 Tax=Flagellimonas taeanensis TaxID=1005926 RepID=UPI002E7B507C|nr:putative quinol monooxygenase [Allomuricauda taeanensis]MEE1964151.1 putative quinol monooxygenase [Allomuricauda taeanensis]